MIKKIQWYNQFGEYNFVILMGFGELTSLHTGIMQCISDWLSYDLFTYFQFSTASGKVAIPTLTLLTQVNTCKIIVNHEERTMTNVNPTFI